jgi:hypothetical protein
MFTRRDQVIGGNSKIRIVFSMLKLRKNCSVYQIRINFMSYRFLLLIVQLAH